MANVSQQGMFAEIARYRYASLMIFLFYYWAPTQRERPKIILISMPKVQKICQLAIHSVSVEPKSTAQKGIDELHTILEHNRVDIAAMTGTWLSWDTPKVSMSGYTVHH